jgi:hypothetical protein
MKETPFETSGFDGPVTQRHVLMKGIPSFTAVKKPSTS